MKIIYVKKGIATKAFINNITKGDVKKLKKQIEKKTVQIFQ